MEVYVYEVNEVGRVYFGKTERSGHERHAEHLEPTNYQNPELFYDMLKYGYTRKVLENNIDSVEELDRLEKNWIRSYNADDPRYGYNGGDKGRQGYEFGDRDRAANFPVVSTLTKTYPPFRVNKSHVGQEVLYRWQPPEKLSKKDKERDPIRCEGYYIP